MDKPDKGETLFSVVFVSIVIGEIAVVGAALWRASGWKLSFVVMALLLFISLSSYVFCRAAAIGDGDYDFDEMEANDGHDGQGQAPKGEGS